MLRVLRRLRILRPRLLKVLNMQIWLFYEQSAKMHKIHRKCTKNHFIEFFENSFNFFTFNLKLNFNNDSGKNLGVKFASVF